MKKFTFSLDTVLSYKQQVQEARQSEHGEALLRMRRQETLLQQLTEQYRAYGQDYAQRCALGLTQTEVMMAQTTLRAMERQLEEEETLLQQLRRREETCRQAVVEAKRETATLEKLRKKKHTEYQKAADKAQELLVEEFVTVGRLRSAAR